MTKEPSSSSRTRSLPDHYCPVCDHKVYNLETHYQTEEHKRHLRQSGPGPWQDEWPKEKGLWWFYGWRFGKEGVGGRIEEPELCLVEVKGPLGSGGLAYITHGHFLSAAEGASGKWQRATLPELPNLEEAPNEDNKG